jgi:hypothetical protein
MILGMMSSETRGLKDISFFLYLNILPSKSKELFPQGLKVFPQERSTSRTCMCYFINVDALSHEFTGVIL